MRTQMLAGLVVVVVAMLASAGRPAAASGEGANVVASIIELPTGAVAAGPVAGAAPDSASSPGHIDAFIVGRFPTGYPAHPMTA
jgi:hypothetical protein